MNYRSLIGIDVSKLTFEVHIHSSNQKKQFGNNDKGYSLWMEWLVKELKQLKQKCLFALSIPVFILLTFPCSFRKMPFHLLCYPL